MSRPLKDFKIAFLKVFEKHMNTGLSKDELAEEALTFFCEGICVTLYGPDKENWNGMDEDLAAVLFEHECESENEPDYPAVH